MKEKTSHFESDITSLNSRLEEKSKASKSKTFCTFIYFPSLQASIPDLLLKCVLFVASHKHCMLNLQMTLQLHVTNHLRYIILS